MSFLDGARTVNNPAKVEGIKVGRPFATLYILFCLVAPGVPKTRETVGGPWSPSRLPTVLPWGDVPQHQSSILWIRGAISGWLRA
jgi:hypothetical protein